MVGNANFRQGVCIIVCNRENKVLWAKRRGKDDWQFPQGGIETQETPEEALYRELEEEIGLKSQHVTLLGTTRHWLTYEWPESTRLAHKDPSCRGQEQKWFLLRLTALDSAINLNHTRKPEFDQWRWVDYWYPLKHIVYFKRKAYYQAIHELTVYR